MGYYENPPIVQPSRGGEIIASSIAGAANSIAEGLLKRGERKREDEKAHQTAMQKMRDEKNKVDLAYNDKLSDWDSKRQHTTEAIDDKIYAIMRDRIKTAADSRIKLLNETDSDIRQGYLRDIRNADQSLSNSKDFAVSIGGEVVTYGEKMSATTIGNPKGHMVNGKDDKERKDNTSIMDVLSNRIQTYQSTNVDVIPGNKGDDFDLIVSGVRGDGTKFEKTVNSADYLKGSVKGDQSLLIPIEDRTDNFKKARSNVMDDKDKMYEAFLGDPVETVPLEGGKYEMRGTREIKVPLIESTVMKDSIIEANGILGAGSSTPTLRAYYSGTLGLPLEDFDAFNALPIERKSAKLAQIINKNNVDKMLAGVPTTKDKDGITTHYWEPNEPYAVLKTKGKSKAIGAGSRGGVTKEPPTTFREGYYNEITEGYVPKEGETVDAGKQNYRTRGLLVKKLNQLEGEENKYMTRERLYKRYAAGKYKENKFDTGLTLEEAFKKGKLKVDPRITFAKKYGKKTLEGQIYGEEEKGVYKEITGYDLSTRRDRVRLALDKTLKEGEKPILQKKLDEAIDLDVDEWTSKNPRKSGESDQEYAGRIRTSLKL